MAETPKGVFVRNRWHRIQAKDENHKSSVQNENVVFPHSYNRCFENVNIDIENKLGKDLMRNEKGEEGKDDVKKRGQECENEHENWNVENERKDVEGNDSNTEINGDVQILPKRERPERNVRPPRWMRDYVMQNNTDAGTDSDLENI